jgi:SAM-dependent methyltransferase
MRGELIEAEHLARYWWVAGLAAGKRVLDAGCGTAYGSEILAQAGGDEVVGVDLDADVIEEARDSVSDSVSLLVGDAHELPLEDSSFDLVVCFELIEHVEEPGSILDELRRVVRPDGIVAVSSPNRHVYPPGNPHHRRELLPDELHEELRGRFAEVRLVRQHDWLASAVLDDEHFTGATEAFASPTRMTVVRRAGEELFAIALASERPLPRLSPQLVLTKTAEMKWWGERLREAEERLAAHEREKARQDNESDEVRQRLNALERRLLELESLLAEQTDLRSRFETSEARRMEVEELLSSVQHTRLWRAGIRYRRVKNLILGRRSSGT